MSEHVTAADKLPGSLPDEQTQPEKRGILGDRFSFDAGLKFWVAKWQPAGSVRVTTPVATTSVNAASRSPRDFI